MSSPVPKPADAKRRRNVTPSALADRKLSLTGRSGNAPRCPVRLGRAGSRWWRWAWSTPQAATWHAGFVEALAKRAEFEDLWSAAQADGDIDGAVKVHGHMAKLDAAFGLTPASAMGMHMSFEAAPAEPAPDATPAGVTDIRDRIKGLGS